MYGSPPQSRDRVCEPLLRSIENRLDPREHRLGSLRPVWDVGAKGLVEAVEDADRGVEVDPVGYAIRRRPLIGVNQRGRYHVRRIIGKVTVQRRRREVRTEPSEIVGGVAQRRVIEVDDARGAVAQHDLAGVEVPVDRAG